LQLVGREQKGPPTGGKKHTDVSPCKYMVGPKERGWNGSGGGKQGGKVVIDQRATCVKGKRDHRVRVCFSIKPGWKKMIRRQHRRKQAPSSQQF